jgi:membrane-associated phospholipid phosphatase
VSTGIRFLLRAWLVAWLLCTSSALSQTKPLQAKPFAEEPNPHRLKWNFPRFRLWEYIAAGAVSVGNIGFEIAYSHQPRDRWTGPILADAAARDFLRADTAQARTTAGTISDYLWNGTTYYVLLDGLLTPLVSDRLNTDVAFQLTLLNWQAVGTAGLLTRLAHVTVGRTRPLTEGCSNDPNSPNYCEFQGASFIAGHAAMTSVNAGLACANHYNLKLYGGGIPDAAVCPILVTAAASVGVLRMIADKHWLSDTLVGWALGGSIGYGMPYLLHYRYARKVLSPLPQTAIVPWADRTAGGLQLMGMF